MTSGQYASIPVEEIFVDERQRFEDPKPDLPELIDSIRRLGLLQPIVLDRGHKLLAGYRRLCAVRELGWDRISFQYEDSTSLDTHFLIEFEENVKRKDFTWQEYTRAVDKYHKIRAAAETAWSVEKTADAMGLGRITVNERLMVAKELENPIINGAESFSKARGLARRIAERRQQDEDERLFIGRRASGVPFILNKSFLTYEHSGLKANLIHCDFPYGIHADKADQGIAPRLAGYEDSPEDYLALLERFGRLDFCAESAHLIFWFSMIHYDRTRTTLERQGWTIDPFPLVWHKSDNAGLLPDPNRGPRRTYETALFGSRADRKIVRAKANSFSHPTTYEYHTHEKPVAVLQHFMEMLVDGNTRLFDPTAGSGTALIAARSLGAADVWGLELNPEHCAAANRALEA